MGQLGLSAQPEVGLPLIQRAATLASVQVPQPAYVYGLLLLGEFAHVTVPPQFFAPLIPPHSSAPQEARLHLERAAFLHFAPAQYKLGHAYEFALAPFPFDALLSVQYYSLASQQGEVEADMALSKWFLCGAEGAFDKDENLAFTFAEKAARKGLPSAEFAMGYYKEVGVGGVKDIEAAQTWYQLVRHATRRGSVLTRRPGFGSWECRRGGTPGGAVPALASIPLPTGTRYDYGIQVGAQAHAGETALGTRKWGVACVARGWPPGGRGDSQELGCAAARPCGDGRPGVAACQRTNAGAESAGAAGTAPACTSSSARSRSGPGIRSRSSTSIPEPTSLHARRPWKWVGRVTPAFTHRVTELRKARRPSAWSTCGEYADAIACDTSGCTRRRRGSGPGTGVTSARGTACQGSHDVCRDGYSGCQARGKGVCDHVMLMAVDGQYVGDDTLLFCVFGRYGTYIQDNRRLCGAGIK